MKTRNGFISNSSSSSFIIAINKEATVDNLCDIIEKSDGFKRLDGHDLSWVRDLPEDMDMSGHNLAYFIAGQIISLSWGAIKISDWLVTGGEYGTEVSDTILDMLFYECYFDMDNELLKVKGVER